ncbi:MAG: hypothetical protein Q8P69_01240 [bacterium]|nr:hypothetical protein [bacterium]
MFKKFFEMPVPRIMTAIFSPLIVWAIYLDAQPQTLREQIVFWTGITLAGMFGWLFIIYALEPFFKMTDKAIGKLFGITRD